MLSGPNQNSRCSILEAWRAKAAGILTSRKGFRRGPLLDCQGTEQLLFSRLAWENETRCCCTVSFFGGVWNGFSLGMSKEEDVPCECCGRVDSGGHLFGVIVLFFHWSG